MCISTDSGSTSRAYSVTNLTASSLPSIYGARRSRFECGPQGCRARPWRLDAYSCRMGWLNGAVEITVLSAHAGATGECRSNDVRTRAECHQSVRNLGAREPPAAQGECTLWQVKEESEREVSALSPNSKRAVARPVRVQYPPWHLRPRWPVRRAARLTGPASCAETGSRAVQGDAAAVGAGMWRDRLAVCSALSFGRNGLGTHRFGDLRGRVHLRPERVWPAPRTLILLGLRAV